MSRELRVGYLSDCDPYDRWAWSGCHFHMATALAAAGARVVPLGAALRRTASRLGRVLRRVLPAGPAAAAPRNELDEARRWGAAVTDEIARSRCDVVFAPVASHVAAFVEGTTPLVYLSDATFALLRGFYPELARLTDDALARRDELEARTIARADALLYSSRWAARSAIRDYGASPDAVHVVSFGANLDAAPTSDDVRARRRAAVCRLLFLGRDWERKGGPIALRTLEALRARGIAAELVVCGADAPPGPRPPHVAWLGNLSKRSARDRARLADELRRAHFLLVPTRADCTPIAFCEAAAYGLPVVTTETGGVESVVTHGRNGFVLPLDAGADAYASVIADVWSDDARFAALVAASRAEYDARLNWDAWAAIVLRVLAGAAGRGMPVAASGGAR